MPDDPVAAAVLAALAAARRHALFVTALQAVLGRDGLDPDRIDAALATLQADGRVIVVGHPSPDPHIAADLRVVADEAGGLSGADAVWSHWLGRFLASHRCG